MLVKRTNGDPRWTRRRVQDWVALACIVAGCAAVVAAAWLWEPVAALAAVGAVVAAAGVWAGLD